MFGSNIIVRLELHEVIVCHWGWNVFRVIPRLIAYVTQCCFAVTQWGLIPSPCVPPASTKRLVSVSSRPFLVWPNPHVTWRRKRVVHQRSAAGFFCSGFVSWGGHEELERCWPALWAPMSPPPPPSLTCRLRQLSFIRNYSCIQTPMHKCARTHALTHTHMIQGEPLSSQLGPEVYLLQEKFLPMRSRI